MLYAGAMFHDISLMLRCSQCERVEVDGADYAAQLLHSHGIAENDVDTLWTAIAPHTTSGVPQHMKPDIGQVCAGAEMDVPGFAHDPFPDAQRDAVVTASARGGSSSRTSCRPSRTAAKPSAPFNVRTDVLAMKDADLVRVDVCEMILNSDSAS